MSQHCNSMSQVWHAINLGSLLQSPEISEPLVASRNFSAIPMRIELNLSLQLHYVFAQWLMALMSVEFKLDIPDQEDGQDDGFNNNWSPNSAINHFSNAKQRPSAVPYSMRHTVSLSTPDTSRLRPRPWTSRPRFENSTTRLWFDLEDSKTGHAWVWSTSE